MAKILFRSVRHSGGYEMPIEREVEPSEALDTLVRFELGYGGVVLEHLDTSVTVRTPGLGCCDVQTFSGTREDMEWLCRVCAAHRKPELDELLEKISRAAPADSRVQALLLSWSVGERRAAVALMRSVEVADPEDLARGLTVNLEQLIPAVQLFHGSGMQFRQVLDTLGV